MSSVFIVGLGQISPVGQGRECLQQALRSSIFPTPLAEKVITAHGEKTVFLLKTPEVELPPSVPEAVKRRMSRLSKMCFATVAEALADAQAREPLEIPPERVGLVIGSAYCLFDLANLFEKRVQLEGPTGASPSLFASSIQNSLASHLSISFNVQGPASTVMTMEHSVAGAFRLAYDWLHQDIVDRAIVAIADEIPGHIRYATAHLADKSVLGEGAVSFILSRYPAVGHYGEVADVALDGESKPPKQSEIWGNMVTGRAFEIAIAALKHSGQVVI